MKQNKHETWEDQPMKWWEALYLVAMVGREIAIVKLYIMPKLKLKQWMNGT
jgi:hypothetical protein